MLAEADVHPRPPRLVQDLLDVILVPDPHVLVAAVRAVEHSRNVVLLGDGGARWVFVVAVWWTE